MYPMEQHPRFCGEAIRTVVCGTFFSKIVHTVAPKHGRLSPPAVEAAVVGSTNCVWPVALLKLSV